MTNSISENIFPVNVQNVKNDNLKDSMPSGDFIAAMAQMCISDENSENIIIQTENIMLPENTKDGREDVSNPEINDYTAVLENALYNMYIPVNQIVPADLSEISLNTDNNVVSLKTVDEANIDNAITSEYNIVSDKNIQPVSESIENIIPDINIENTDKIINVEQPEKIVSENIQPEKTVPENAQPQKTVSENIQPEKTVSENIQPEKTVPENAQPQKFVSENIQPVENIEIPYEVVQNIQSENNQIVNVNDDYNYKAQPENNYLYVSKDITDDGNNIRITERKFMEISDDIPENTVVQTEIKSETVSNKNTVSDENKISDFIPKNSESADNANILSRPVKNQQENSGDSNSHNNNSSFSEKNMFIRENAIKSDFYKNVSQVKEFIRNNNEELNKPVKTDIAELENDMQEIDISQLQSSAMNNLKFADIGGIIQKSVNQDSNIYNATEILKQAADGIIENMHGDADKFTVMLNPEGLGKIEVTILKGDNSNMLSLAVSDAKTAEILSGDISSLHKALEHLNIEVSDIRVENPQESHQYNGYEEQFERDNPNNNHRRNHNRYNDFSEDDEDDDFSEDNIYSEPQMMSYI